MYREIFKGKNISRVQVFSALTDFFKTHKEMLGALDILEIGKEPASHERTFPKAWKIHSANYIKKENTEYVFDASKKFPFADGQFDGTVMFNVLYLIEDYKLCLEECLRVSKNFVLFNVPLISGIAKDPNDYNRFTEDKIKLTIESVSGSSMTYEIIPVGATFSASVALLDTYLRFKPVRIFFNLCSIPLDKLDKKIGRSCPIQYLVYIKKK